MKIDMKKFWNWLKHILSKLFHRAREKVVVEPKLSTAQEKCKVEPVRYAHNMPKYQPCSKGHGWKRRLVKTFGGANYWCNQCKSSFFVRTRA